MKRAALQLYPELLSTPELRAIQAQRLIIDRVYGQIRELQAELHAVRCAERGARGDAAAALRKREAELDARIILLRDGDAPE